MKFCIPALLILLCFSCKKNGGSDEKPILSNDDILARGVNLSNWFNDYSDPAQYTSRFSLATLKIIKSNQFTYVRIPIGPNILFDPAHPDQLNATNLPFVETAVSNSIAAGLGVTINVHPSDEATDNLLANQPGFDDKLAAYWKAIALYFGKFSPDSLFFEVYNEPHASAAGLTSQDFSWWQPVQGKMVSAIREVDANHNILVGGDGWNSIAGLTQLTPYNFDRIIYVFHFYDPFLFTHQGATWTNWHPALVARNVPYPSSPSAVAPLVAATSDAELKDALGWYGHEQYNIDSLDKWIKVAYDWGKAKNVRVINNEFGSYKTYSPRQSRLNYLHDVRTVFDKYKIGWAMWDCDEGFGWIDYTSGYRNQPIADDGVLKALGLQ